jgi:hypothetical protein
VFERSRVQISSLDRLSWLNAFMVLLIPSRRSTVLYLFVRIAFWTRTTQVLKVSLLPHLIKWVIGLIIGLLTAAPQCCGWWYVSIKPLTGTELRPLSISHYSDWLSSVRSHAPELSYFLSSRATVSFSQRTVFHGVNYECSGTLFLAVADCQLTR